MANETSEKLQLLKKYYIEKLTEDFSYWYQGTTNESTEEHLHALKDYFHKVSGSGGSFGFNSISVYAKAGENLVKSVLAEAYKNPSELVLSEESFAKLSKIFESLKLEIALTSQNKDSFLDQQQELEETSETLTQVWILDDDQEFSAFLGEQLGSFGFEVSTFSNLEDFKNAWLVQSPGFLIADVHIGNNRTFYELFAEYGLTLGTTELVICSSSDTLDNRLHAVRFGALTFLPKPFDVAKLANLFRDCITDINASPGKVLVIDDDEELSQLYQLALQEAGINAFVVNQPENTLKSIQEHNPDLVLIDLYMPEINGTELASVIRQHDAMASLPIVYLSSEIDSQRQSAALSRGADDFLTKPIDSNTLALAVRSRIRRARQLQKLINRDSLTGLLKHSSIKDALVRDLKRAKRKEDEITVCMLDIDHFKRVNDTHGHATGDMVIASLATLLVQTLRQTDAIGRYGGEEFLLVMPDCGEKNAEQILNKIRKRFEAIKFTSGTEVFSCSLSAGYISTLCSAQLETTYEDLIEVADQALYQAKHNGRNQVVKSQTSIY
ncbi:MULTISPECIES: diguanylate cyclase [Gammaproteobacteria]|uniref:GGDEF domain-containing response regulator n=1 Tax=Gammaproteobacteria TaxID=1236 RepID=UPI000DCFA0D8|nr:MULTISPECIES: diguanylate cyclase [Gammaproteobacteria]RTE86582.1 diguanylate cyclase [Aliidiomarina sp. B3213]TCZ90863.1 diguanylate cyclase [Lysobacter sp. N42]